MTQAALDLARSHDAFDAGDAAAGWKALLAASEAGHPEALREVAWAYLVGQHDRAPAGVPRRSRKRGVAAYERLIAAGDREAMATLARLLTEGELLRADPARALALYERAADLGAAEAALVVGVAYAEGGFGGHAAPDAARAIRRLAAVVAADDPLLATQAAAALAPLYLAAGVPRDEARAWAMARAAVAGGQDEAGVLIAIMSEQGIGTPKRPKRAVALYREAAFLDGTGMAFYLAHAGAAIALAPPPPEPRRAPRPKPVGRLGKQLARWHELGPTAHDRLDAAIGPLLAAGDPQALFFRGWRLGEAGDAAAQLDHWRRAVAAGSLQAAAYMAGYPPAGATPADRRAAGALMRRLAEHGDPEAAQRYLGTLSPGRKADRAAALGLLEALAENGPKAPLAQAHEQGAWGLAPDPDRALALYLDGAAADDAACEGALRLLQARDDVHPGWARLVPVLRQRAGRGDPAAAREVGLMHEHGFAGRRDPHAAAAAYRRADPDDRVAGLRRFFLTGEGPVRLR